MKMNLRRWMSVACTLWLTASLCGCGGGEPVVRYSGTTLVVDGTSYERRTSAEINLPGELVPGMVFVAEQVGQHEELVARLDELGLLDRESYAPVYSFLVTVPTGWEDQWARVLMAQPQVQYAELNFSIPLDPGFEAPVQYLDTVLVVDGVRYEKRTPEEINGFYSAETVFVGEKDGRRMALEARLDELGFAVRQRYDLSALFELRVPAGWEDQWARALLAQPQVRFAWLDLIPIVTQ